MNEMPANSTRTRTITADPTSLALEAYRLLARVQASGTRLVLALAGGPGNGKSTVAAALAAAINRTASRPDSPAKACAIAVSLDGFHYPKATLDTFSDPIHAHARRGAPFTFDARGYLAAITSLLDDSSQSDLAWPDFDHRVGDPVLDAIRITREHTIVIVEGLYVLSAPPGPAPRQPAKVSTPLSHDMDQPEWALAAAMVHERWWVDVSPEDVAETRLAERHVRTGLAKDMHSARQRIRGNDALNAAWVKASIQWDQVDVIVDNSMPSLATST